MSILDKIYHEWYMMKSGNYPDSRESQRRFSVLWEKAQAELGQEFSEELHNSIFDYMDDECSHDFRAGFRLGALLMAELYSPSAPRSAAP